jgi:hypothetical protein
MEALSISETSVIQESHGATSQKTAFFVLERYSGVREEEDRNI